MPPNTTASEAPSRRKSFTASVSRPRSSEPTLTTRSRHSSSDHKASRSTRRPSRGGSVQECGSAALARVAADGSAAWLNCAPLLTHRAVGSAQADSGVLDSLFGASDRGEGGAALLCATTSPATCGTRAEASRWAR
ncbi:hypothetical protein PsYK624_012540 [Phanerochaete sordida]|uniref:Uncharacterized protein n=1 Tax=Phanerochaete sordida TaxID=48140 RepID=A0A9P3FYY5_9APHY|nr:hypothetical protein PsYK624_012540 [Phanerochaete sordida]